MADEIRIMDIALLPQHRGRDIGRALLREVLDEGTRVAKFVSVQVEAGNPANHLYERMGFVVAGALYSDQRMHWIPMTWMPTFYGDGSARDPVTPLRAMEDGPHIDAVLHARPNMVAAGPTREWQIREAP